MKNSVSANGWRILDDKVVLVTGGTGSFGNAFVKAVLENTTCSKIIIFSRDEMKQWEMQKRFEAHHDRLRFFIGDVRDRDRLYRAFRGVNIVIHAAATKIVPTAEYNPFECIKTNINGAMNVMDAALDRQVEVVVALSTDKACSPINLYGASKLASDKIFISGNNYAGKDASTRFSVVRYGNVMGSRGSVIPFFISIADKNEFPITDFNMTRFMITLEEGINLVVHALADSIGGELYIKKIKSMKITDITKAINPNAKLVEVEIRPGEKIHEKMVGIEDAPFTFEYPGYYKILPMINDWYLDTNRIKAGTPVAKDFEYCSENNEEWMSVEDLKSWIKTKYYEDRF